MATYARAVQAIRVGGEWFGIEDETGNHLPSVTISEQCDSCGAGGYFEQTIDQHKSVFVCIECGYQPPMSYQRPQDIVWPDDIDYSDD